LSGLVLSSHAVEEPKVPRIESRSLPYGGWRPFYHLLALVLLLALPGAADARGQQLVLAFGDSLTAGYQLRPNESFPARLEAELRRQGRDVRVVNAGVSGDTTAQGRARLSWVLHGLQQQPDLAIVALGANDMLRGQPPAQARANLDAIIGELRKRGIPVIVAGMLAAPNLGPEYTKEYNAIFPGLARQHNATLYPFFLRGVAGNRARLLADGMHPNPAGVQVMVAGMAPVVARELDRAAAR
jgi:acyl-CoA thioesterase-1